MARSVKSRRSTSSAGREAGGPFKPSFGLSGAVRQLNRVSLPLARAFLPSTRTRSPLVLRALLRFVRENSVVPTGLESSVSLLPALKRWAKLGRPSGAGQVLRVHFVSGFATDSASLRVCDFFDFWTILSP